MANNAITAGTGNRLIMNLVNMVETRVENHKIQLPKKIDGLESDIKRAVILHTTAGKLEAAKKHTSARGRIEMLAKCLAFSHSCKKYLEKLDNEYREVFFDPANWTTKEFLDHKGAVLNDSTMDADP